MQLVLVVANYNCMLHKIVNIIIVYIHWHIEFISFDGSYNYT